jgi:hypothetical protein
MNYAKGGGDWERGREGEWNSLKLHPEISDLCELCGEFQPTKPNQFILFVF